MKAGQCFFHIGFPKTGTSYLQSNLENNRKNMKAAGILYPQNLPVQRDLILSFLERPEEHSRSRAGPGRGTREAVRAAARKARESIERELEASCYDKLVLSFEDYAGVFESASLNIERIQDFLFGVAEEVFIICYVREHRAHTISYAQQRIKMGNLVIDDVLDHFPVLFRPALERYMSLFGRDAMIVRAYDSAGMVGGDLVADFRAACGLEDVPFSLCGAEGGINRSISLEAAGIGSAANARRPNFQDGRHTRPNPERATLHPLLESIPGAPFSLSGDVLASVREKARDDAAWLAEQFGIDFREYPDPTPAGIPEWSNETLEAVGVLLNDTKKERDENEQKVENLHRENEAYLDMLKECVNTCLETDHLTLAEDLLDRLTERVGWQKDLLKARMRLRLRQGRPAEAMAIKQDLFRP